MVRFGIAGYGLHAAKRLVPALKQAKGCELVALARRNGAQADAAAMGLKHGVSSTRELCELAAVDAVVVTSPNALHFADVMTCLAKGKHVLCEKPMALSAGDAEAMVAEAEKRGLVLGVAQSYRFCWSVEFARNVVKSGEIGKAVACRVDFSFVGLNSERRWLTDAALAGGGPIADIGVHAVDTMRYVLDDEVESCSAVTTRDASSGGVEASAALSLRFRSGALGSSVVSFRSPYDTHLEVLGTQGRLVALHGLDVDEPVAMEVVSAAGRRVVMVDNRGLYERQMEAFCEAIEKGARFAAPGGDGVKNQQVLDALFASAKVGVTIRVEGE